jgi:hypothetical protein
MTNSSFNLTDLNGINGFPIINLATVRDDNLGQSVSNAGDINNDGIDDVIIQAPGVGLTYVVFGSATVGSLGFFNLTALDGTNGFIIRGSGTVSNAGDINNDGIDDVIIGNNVIFGSATLGNASNIVNLSDLSNSNGFIIEGSTGLVKNAGDINDDGIDDLIVGAPSVSFNSNTVVRENYVIFGDETVGNGGILNVSTLNGTNGFIIGGIAQDDNEAIRVSALGDINNDGVDDLIIGARGADPNGISNAGASYVVFGGTTVGSNGTFDVANLDGTNGFVMNGDVENNFSGFSVSGVGDINSDGIDDLIIGARGVDSNGISDAGQSYVVFGSATVGSSGTFNLSELNGTNGFIINPNTGNNFLANVSALGDFNNDGIDDLVIGIPSASPNGIFLAGQTYVVFGSTTLGNTGTLNFSELDGTNGFVINGVGEGDTAGSSISTAGDINDDGIDDLIIGAPDQATLSRNTPGESYIIYGNAFTNTTSTIDGKSARDTLSGTSGNDIIAGGGGGDIISGGAGNDVFIYNNIRDAGDAITDFVSGADVILLSRNLFLLDSELSFNYDTATDGGYLGFRTQGNDTTILIDPDGLVGRAIPTALVRIENVSFETLSNSDNFVFSV